ncbi:DUF602-domain-containing protein [Atractiella rhizophila]|nr:DUF602-domain-containing protein [Atractiella rhizophila]
MGNDGGSIPKRDDLVKNKAKSEKVDSESHTLATWFYCQLSKELLRAPVVSCRLGKLYNKDAVISFLLHRSSASSTAATSSFGADGALVASHLTSLKDVTTLNLTPNPAFSPKEGKNGNATFGTVADGKAQWVCPISMKEMNGLSGKFGYFEECGCVLSEQGLKEVRASTSKSATTASSSEEPSTSTSATPELLSCPVCATERRKEDEHFIIINPKGTDLDLAKAAVELKVKEAEEERAAKKRLKAEAKAAKKRKAGDSDAPASKDGVPDEPSLKKSKKENGRGMSVLPKNGIEKEVLDAVSKAKEKMSPAVAALYQKGTGQKETWMTRGTWTRYAG